LGGTKVRIDGANWVPAQGNPETPQSLQKPPRSTDAPEARIDGGGSEVRSALAPYVRAVMAGEEIDEQAVAQARRLLQSGELDTPEAARRAAEALMRLGI
jgi:hypothetical protein